MDDQLIQAAIQARAEAYAPYSRFPVGAAVLTTDGQIFSGCNVENGSYGLTICAERVAIFKAVSAGHRSFSKLCIVADSDAASPCGACRQVIWEFGPDAEIVVANLKGEQRRFSCKELLPHPFRP